MSALDLRCILIKNGAKRKKKTTLMILAYGSAENLYIDLWDCCHRRF